MCMTQNHSLAQQRENNAGEGIFATRDLAIGEDSVFSWELIAETYEIPC